MTNDELADEYLESADNIQTLIDRLKEKTKNVSWQELPFIYKRIENLKQMQSDCWYSARQLRKHKQ